MAKTRSKGASILLELKDIIESTKLFEDISFDRVKDLTEVDKFNACHIMEDNENATFTGQTTLKANGYDRYMIVSLHISLDMEEPTEYKDIQEELIKVILDDTKIFTNSGLLDRDYLGASWDRNRSFDDDNYKKQGIIQFEFRYRTDCN